MKHVVVATLFGALALAACSTGVLDLLPSGQGGGGSSASTSSEGGTRAPSSSEATSTSSGGDGGVASGGGGASNATGSGGGCPDADCPCGLQTCLGACVDTKNDPAFCGGCDNPCKHNQACENGQCTCLPGFMMCSDGSCHHVASDPDHCGSCPTACNQGQACDNGQCSDHGCSGNRSACPVSDSRTSCVDLASGEPYCGSCGTICGPTQVCAGEHCVDFKPSTPCSTCPCDAVCGLVFAAPVTCCEGIAQSHQPICVHADACP